MIAALPPVPARRDQTIRVGNNDHLLPPNEVERVAPSQLAAFLLGGTMIAGGLMAFLFYDAALPNRLDVVTTGSIAPPAITAPAPDIAVPTRQARPQAVIVDPR